MSFLSELHKTIDAACPIDGTWGAKDKPKSEWGFWPKAEATPEQITAGQAALDAFDVTAYDAAKVAAQARFDEIAADTGRTELLDKLKTASRQQITDWLAANVTTIAQARAVLAAVIYQLVVLTFPPEPPEPTRPEEPGA